MAKNTMDWLGNRLLPITFEGKKAIRTEDGNVYLRTYPDSDGDMHYYETYSLRHIPEGRAKLTLHHYIDETEPFYRLESIDLDTVCKSVTEIHLYGCNIIPDNFIRNRTYLPNLRKIVLKKEMNAQAGCVMSRLFHPVGLTWRDAPADETKKFFDEAISYLLSTFMPYIVMAEKTGDKARYEGLTFKLYENGACSLCEIAGDLTHVRIPQAIFVEGRYYIVISFSASSQSLKSLHISNVLYDIRFKGLTSLETLTCDENAMFKVIDGALYRVSGRAREPYRMIWFPRNYPTGEYRLPDSLTEIECGAFDNCLNIPVFTGGADYWKVHDTIWLPEGCRATEDGNVFKTVASFDPDDEAYYHVLLKRIGPNQQTISLQRSLKKGHIKIQGIDLDGVYESVTELHLYGIRSIPENFIRRKSCLPNLKRIVFMDNGDSPVDIPDLIYHKEVVYTPLNESRTEVATVYPSDGYCLEGNLSIPAGFSDGDHSYIVTAIGDESFRNCPGLEAVSIPPTVRIIGEGAFSRCMFLSTVDIPASVVEIGKDAFSYCPQLSGIDFTEGVDKD